MKKNIYSITVFDEWNQNNDVVINKKNEFELFLKAFHGAPLFTINEFKIFEKCFLTDWSIQKRSLSKKKKFNE